MDTRINITSLVDVTLMLLVIFILVAPILNQGIDLKLPSGPQQKRLGEYHKLTGGRIRLNFDDEESLHGIMIMNRKKKTSTVWIGVYKEMENRRTVREYLVELRTIED